MSRVSRLHPRMLWMRLGPVCTGIALGIVVVVAAISIEFSSGPSPVDSKDARPELVNPAMKSKIVYGQALVEFPQDTASDVVSYADELVLVTVVSQRRIDDLAESEEGAGGLVTREVSFRVDDVVWRRMNAPSVPENFAANRGGWLTQTVNDQNPVTSKFVTEGAPWLEVGRQYLVPVAFNHGRWMPIMPLAEFAYIDGRVVVADRQTTLLAQRLSGLSIHEVRKAFALANPDPLAVVHNDLQASDRLAAVTAG